MLNNYSIIPKMYIQYDTNVFIIQDCLFQTNPNLILITIGVNILVLLSYVMAISHNILVEEHTFDIQWVNSI